MSVKIARFCRQNRIDLIHAHQCTPWFYASLSRRIYCNPRLLLEEHGRNYPEVKKNGRIRLNRWFIEPMTHRVVAVSNDVRKRLVEYEGLKSDRIEVVYNGVEEPGILTDQEKAELRKYLGFGPDDFVVGTVGRCDPIKNLPMLIRGIARSRDKLPNIRGLLVGDGPQFGEIAKLISGLNLSQAVVMTGHREDARKILQCMDLFVLSSFSEGMSMALLEAMASGVACAVTQVGGNPELVIKNETGWVIPSDSTEALSQTIADACENILRRQAFAESGRHRYRSEFTFKAMIGNYRRIYSQLL
jgi:glycosyltransferase involved in cell wall biosynthesis